MSGRVIQRLRAKRDLLEQAVFLGERSEAAALRFMDASEQTFKLLAAHPKMGRLVQLANPLMAAVRWFPVQGFEKHLVFYRPLENGIEVLRIIHGARDIESLLGQ